MRVLEAGRIFQTKPQHAIKPDVCHPDESKESRQAVPAANGICSED
jgi:hypothetical protein